MLTVELIREEELMANPLPLETDYSKEDNIHVLGTHFERFFFYKTTNGMKDVNYVRVVLSYQVVPFIINDYEELVTLNESDYKALKNHDDVQYTIRVFSEYNQYTEDTFTEEFLDLSYYEDYILDEQFLSTDDFSTIETSENVAWRVATTNLESWRQEALDLVNHLGFYELDDDYED